MENIFAIKLLVGNVSVKACMAIKKMTGFSPAEIKSKAENDEFAFVCDYLDDAEYGEERGAMARSG